MYFLFIYALLLLLPSGSLAEAVTINAVGDIMLAGSGRPIFRKNGYDYPFAATSDILRNGDIVTGNLEAPITARGEEFISKKYRFRAEPAAASALKRAGFTHLSLANNHILDFGAAGLQETRAFLDMAKIATSGAGPDLTDARRERIVIVKGKKIAFLSYSLTYPSEFFATARRPGTAPGYVPFFTEDIRRAKKISDYVIVSFHWGEESSSHPKEYQKNSAHLAIDAGAHIILGHHPHVLQGVELYRQGVIFYSLGNFAFASRSKSADRSIIARITLDKGIEEVEIIPINVLNSEVAFQPKILGNDSASLVARRVDSLSTEMGTRIVSSGGRFIARPVTADLAEAAATTGQGRPNRAPLARLTAATNP